MIKAKDVFRLRDDICKCINLHIDRSDEAYSERIELVFEKPQKIFQQLAQSFAELSQKGNAKIDEIRKYVELADSELRKLDLSHAPEDYIDLLHGFVRKNERSIVDGYYFKSDQVFSQLDPLGEFVRLMVERSDADYLKAKRNEFDRPLEIFKLLAESVVVLGENALPEKIERCFEVAIGDLNGLYSASWKFAPNYYDLMDDFARKLGLEEKVSSLYR
ncbi:MAG TPA: hypothetical protein PK129_13000 [Cellvibrionaceae bacterium]|nr:hypothetical protein [Cellvibrionaceae bacterium]